MKANDVVTLRVLTEKSKLGFGKYHDVTIGDILKVDPTYVAWIYCNHPSISFHKDILKKLQLEDIPKPGINNNYFYNWRNAYVIRTYSKEERMHFVVKKRAMEKRKAHASLAKAIRDEHKTKGQLQAMNLNRMHKS